MNTSLDQIAQMTADYERDILEGSKKSEMEPLVIASIGLSNLTLDLLWAVEWLNTLKDRLKDDHMVQEFMDELNERVKQSESLRLVSQEANLL